jgi:hypothetical protein
VLAIDGLAAGDIIAVFGKGALGLDSFFLTV